MIGPEVLDQFIKDRYGSLLTKDQESELGWKPWTAEDTKALSEWLSSNGNGNGSLPRLTYKLEEASKVAGVGVHVIQSWVRRENNPLPSFREGRRIVVPHKELVEWLGQEAKRHINGRRQER